jgi:hypothetical protein
MPPRVVMGLEAELGILGLPDHPGEREQTCRALVRAIGREQPFARGGDPKHAHCIFLGNGGAFGPDPPRSMVPEYDTPECLSPFSLAASLTAGMRIVARAADRVAAERREREPAPARLIQLRGDLRLVAASMFYQGDESGLGHHENYGIRWPSGRAPTILQTTLLPWIVTRQLLTEPGFLTCAEDTAGFGLSPRAPAIERICGESTTHNRAIFTSGRTAYARRGWIRLHVIAAGATLSPWAVALRHGGTALFLTMALRGCALPPALEVTNPIAALHQVALDPTATILIGAGAATPLSVLKQLYAWVEEEHGRRSLAPWADRLLAEWRLGLALAEAQIETSEIWLEHALRRRILGLYLAEAGIRWEEIRFWFHFLRLAERYRAHPAPLPQTPFGDRVRELIKTEFQPLLDRRLIAAGGHWHDLPVFRRHLQRLWALDIELNRIVGGIADRQSEMRRSLGAEVISEEDIQRAEVQAPDPTRARVRSQMIRHHAGDDALRATWDGVRTRDGHFSLPTPLSRKLQPSIKKQPERSRMTGEERALFERMAAPCDVCRRRRAMTPAELQELQMALEALAQREPG